MREANSTAGAVLERVVIRPCRTIALLHTRYRSGWAAHTGARHRAVNERPAAYRIPRGL